MTDRACPASWVDIHRDRLSGNIQLALDLVPKGSDFCAVLKADAYGHGIEQVVPLILEKGISSIGVTSNSEAAAVRRAGFPGRLIRLRVATETEMREAVEWQLEEQVSSLSAARTLSAIDREGGHVRAHLTLNASGMSRDGLEVSTDNGRAIAIEILSCLEERIVGICTHFPNNAVEDLRNNAALFQEQVNWVFANSGLCRSNVLVHAGSSLTLVSGEPIETDMYRCGAILYGILKPELGFQTTMSLKARVVSLSTYPKGASVGYDRACRLKEDRRLASITIGYANGIRRDIFDGGAVMVGNTLTPIVGKVSMNVMVIDVTGVREVQIGDEAVLFDGRADGPTSLAGAEHQFGTIMADLFTDWGQRNHRIYR